MRALFWFSLLAILYFCLYPFRLNWDAAWHWPQFRVPVTLADIRDFGLNVILFFPLGVFGVLGFGDRRRELLALGLGLSAGIELLQIWIPGRNSNLFDWFANALGVMLGVALAGQLLGRLDLKTLKRLLTPVTLSIGILFVCSKMAPFFPELSPYPFRMKLARLIQSKWLLEEILVGLAEGAVVAQVFRLDRLVSSMVLMSSVFGAFFIAGGAWRPGVVAGNLLAGMLIVFPWLLEKRWPVAWTFTGILLYVQFHPFVPGAYHELNWVPFGNAMDLRLPVLGIMAGKTLLYFGTIYFWQRTGMGLGKATAFCAAVVALGEWTQQYLPGRTPEVTDPLLCLLCGGLLLCDIIYVIRSSSSGTPNAESRLLDSGKKGRID